MKCVIDQQTELETGQVCDRCRRREHWKLDEILRLWQTLPDQMEPGTSTGPKVGGSREAPLPLSVDALDLSLPARALKLRKVYRQQMEDQIGHVPVASVLDSWVRDWRDVRDRGERLPVPTVPMLVAWLRSRLDDACDEHPAIDEYSQETAKLLRALRTVSKEHPAPPERLWTPCRDCQQLTLARHAGDDYPIRCAGCDLSMTEDEYRQWTKLVAAHAA